MASAETTPTRLPTLTLVSFALPTLGVGFLSTVLSVYVVKFASDVLLVAPAAIGTIFGLSRIWDAITDPLAGHLSDRTRTSLGRRRPWLLASALPLALFGVMVWSPPLGLEGPWLVAWLAVAVFGFYTASTIFVVPHAAFGAELSDDHHERTRVFGFRGVGWGLGGFLGMGLGIGLLESAVDKRAMATWLSLVAGLVTVAMLVFAAVRLRERPEFQGRGGQSPYSAFRDVWRNPHARLLFGMFFIERIGVGALMVLAPFLIEYVIGGETAPLLIGYFIPNLASIPIWVRLSRRFGKKPLWLFALGLSAAGFGAIFLVPEGSMIGVLACAVVAGIGGGCGSTVAPSVQADVIDWDEHATGERKEGAYYSAWSFCDKTAIGVAAMFATFALQASGFEPNVEQSETTKLVIRGLVSLGPLVCYAIGILIFSRFRLTQAEHARLRRELDARAPRDRETS